MWEVIDKEGRVINSFYRESDAKDFRSLRQLYDCRIVFNKHATDAVMYHDFEKEKKKESK